MPLAAHARTACLVLAALVGVPGCDPGPWEPVRDGEVPPPRAGWLKASRTSLYLEVRFGDPLDDGLPRADLEAFSLRNDADRPVQIWGLTNILGSDAFRVVDTTPSTELPAGHGTTLTVAFLPSPGDADYSARLQIHSDISGQDPIEVQLFGEARAPRLGWTMESPRSAVGCAAPAELRLVNEGRLGLTIDVASEDSLGPFTLEDLPRHLQPGSDRVVRLSFAPRSQNDTTGTILLQTNELDERGDPSVVEVPLRGVVPNATRTERFFYGRGSGAHVLLLMDEQGTTASYQAKVLYGLGPFVESLRGYGVAFRVAAVDTEHACPGSTRSYGTFADRTEDLVTWLREPLFDAGVGRYSDKLLELARRALAQAGDGGCLDGFLEPDRPLHLVAISDRPERSAAGWAAEIATIGTLHEGRVVLSSVIPLSGCAATPHGYVDATIGTSGELHDLCRADWSETWERLAALTAQFEEGQTTFQLAEPPVKSTLEVRLDGVPYTSYAISGSGRLILGTTPPDGTRVDVSYIPASACEVP